MQCNDLNWNRNNLQGLYKAKSLSVILHLDFGHWILKSIPASCWDLQHDVQSSALPLPPEQFIPRTFPAYLLLFGFPLLFTPFPLLSCNLFGLPSMYLSLSNFFFVFSFYLMTLVSSCSSVHCLPSVLLFQECWNVGHQLGPTSPFQYFIPN